MKIESLSLNNFRNYKNLKTTFSKNLNIIYGENAQGKTNIIEAIFLCASGRSHRTSKESELVNVNSSGFYVRLHVIKQEEDKTIEISYENGKKKLIKINEIPVRKIGNLMGNLLAVVFSPEDLLIIKEGPSQRRRFIDITISQLKPSYFYDLQIYNKLLLQRNTLLKEIHKNNNLIDTLEIWDEKIAEVAAKIMIVRHDFINKLCDVSEKIHYKLTNDSEKLNILYNPSVRIEKFSDINKLKDMIITEFTKSRALELRRSITLIGPHRDDYEMVLNDLSLKMYGSQGQQRTAILSLKFAEIEIVKDETDDYPVLLLDDVMSELDTKRREYLFENLSKIQTFITCTEKDFFDNKKYGDTIFINVKSGELNIHS